MAEVYKTPIIAQQSSGFTIDTRNTPFSTSTYKVVFNCQTQDPDDPAVFLFNTDFVCAKEFYGVKSISLLYALFPFVNTDPTLGGTDQLVTIQSTWKDVHFVGSYPPRSTNSTITNGAEDQVTGCYATLLHPDYLLGVDLNYLQDYPIVETFPTTINFRRVRFRFFNGLGLPLAYGSGQGQRQDVVMCFEITCQGVK